MNPESRPVPPEEQGISHKFDLTDVNTGESEEMKVSESGEVVPAGEPAKQEVIYDATADAELINEPTEVEQSLAELKEIEAKRVADEKVAEAVHEPGAVEEALDDLKAIQEARETIELSDADLKEVKQPPAVPEHVKDENIVEATPEKGPIDPADKAQAVDMEGYEPPTEAELEATEVNSVPQVEMAAPVAAEAQPDKQPIDPAEKAQEVPQDLDERIELQEVELKSLDDTAQDIYQELIDKYGLGKVMKEYEDNKAVSTGTKMKMKLKGMFNKGLRESWNQFLRLEDRISEVKASLSEDKMLRDDPEGYKKMKGDQMLRQTGKHLTQ
jgi:hypothetical protein